MRPASSAEDVESSSRKRSQTPHMPANRRSQRVRRIQENFPAIGAYHVPTAAITLPPPTSCNKCCALKFAFESRNFCCADGEIRIVNNEIPPELLNLLGAKDDTALHFQNHIRTYNSMFAFSSLGGQTDVSYEKGIYVFHLLGQLYHYVPPLFPGENSPKYLQLYFYDPQEEQEHRNGLFPEIRAEIVSILMQMMENNPYARFFRSLREFNFVETTKVIIRQNPGLDQRVYNTPSSDEVAAILVESCTLGAENSPHILVHGPRNESHRVMHYYGCYDPLQYPLLHPRGESGWHQGLKRVSSTCRQRYTNPTFPVSSALVQNAADLFIAEAAVATSAPSRDSKEISCREYYAYKLQIRPGNYLLKVGRLFQQYIVDMYVKIENTRLDYLRRNQSTIRADLYQGILDSVSTGENNPAEIGRRIILPPSFIGGPRDVKRRYLNAMTLVQKFGKPDLFITITCNPNWPEIKEQLLSGEKPENRPDLIAHVFHAKLTIILNEIVKKKAFGPVAARVHVIEFQKRGLPHEHLLMILEGTHKIKRPEDFDLYVCAEIPSVENPHLRSVVLRHMIHGPCGALNKDSPCMKLKNGRKICRFKYPKPFAEFTTCGDDSYPIYRRRETGEKINIRGAKLDNKWVTPYNPYLSALFDCHINVEICSTISAVKYLYKYIYKGHDRVNFNIIRESMHANDEISSFQSARWISPPEAAWRIFSFQLYDISPAVILLQVHLPNMQSISFTEHENLEHIASNHLRSQTMLTQFFHNNSLSQGADTYLYSEYPEHFVWNPSDKTWTRRMQRGSVGRLAYVSPSEGERHYLRLLLSHVRGPKSFHDLLIVQGHYCVTFQEAAQKRGLLQTDGYAEACMNEAAQVQMPHALRRLFATLLVFCEPENPSILWEKNYKCLSEDFKKQYPTSEETVLNLTCAEVERYLEGMHKTLKDYKLDHLITSEDTLATTRDIRDALSAPVPPEYAHASKKLNIEQRIAYKCIMHHVKSEKPGAFFVDGPGGTGKTFLYCALYAKVRSMGKIVLPTATSGIATSNIPTGRTAHSRFKIPTDEDNSLTCNVSKQSSLAHLLRHTSLIIWDKASMAKKENIEALNALLQDICDNTTLFGKKVVVFGGDFRQVLPVLPRKTQLEAVNASLVNSYLWPHLIKFKLTHNMRAHEDPQFSKFLLHLGNGALQNEEHAYVQLPHGIGANLDNITANFDTLTDMVFPEMRSPSTNPKIYNERAILTPKNDDVDRINESLIQQFHGTSITYNSYDSVVDDNSATYPIEFLNTLCPSGMSPHQLHLKENCPIILLRNLDPSSGLCNGTRLICKKFFPNLIQCEINSGYYKGSQIFLPRITLKTTSSPSYPFSFERKQFPIKLCFAMTINKSQGQTLHHVAIYLQQPCFSHGQLYVAISRATNRNNVKVFTSPSTDQQEPLMAKNVVSFEMLKRAQII